MTRPRSANAAASDLEPFKEVAFAALEAAPLIAPGVCFFPGCGARFTSPRSWQIYCSEGCRRADSAEARAWGHKAALPLLVHRLGKYEASDAAIRERTRQARNYVTRLQSAWFSDRARRIKGASNV